MYFANRHSVGDSPNGREGSNRVGHCLAGAAIGRYAARLAHGLVSETRLLPHCHLLGYEVSVRN